MKRLTSILAVIIAFVACEMITMPDNPNENTGNNMTEEPSKEPSKEQEDTVFIVREGIDSFESMFISTTGYLAAIKKDTTYSYAVYIDSVAVNEETALVAYVDEVGRIHKLYQNGEVISINYNSDNLAEISFVNSAGELETINDFCFTSTKTHTTKAGDVLDPYDIFSVITIGKDTGEILSELAENQKFTGKLTQKCFANVEAIAALPWGNTATAIGLGAISILMATNPAGLTIAIILATLDIANAAINDWQNVVAARYFGYATPVTGGAIQLSDTQIAINYSIKNIDSKKTDFNVGIIVADGMFVTKNHHLFKTTIPYTQNDGHIIINLDDMKYSTKNKYKYRVFLEPRDDNGCNWDDKILDYWRYGEVREFVIGEQDIEITEITQTSSRREDYVYDGLYYIFDYEINAVNNCNLAVDEWGVSIYCSYLSESLDTNWDLLYSHHAENNDATSHTFKDLRISVPDLYMDDETEPYIPLLNYYAVPYVSLNGSNFYLFDNMKKIELEYKLNAPIINNITETRSWIDLERNTYNFFYDIDLEFKTNDPNIIAMGYCIYKSKKDDIFDESCELYTYNHTEVNASQKTIQQWIEIPANEMNTQDSPNTPLDYYFIAPAYWRKDYSGDQFKENAQKLDIQYTNPEIIINSVNIGTPYHSDQHNDNILNADCSVNFTTINFPEDKLTNLNLTIPTTEYPMFVLCGNKIEAHGEQTSHTMNFTIECDLALLDSFEDGPIKLDIENLTIQSEVPFQMISENVSCKSNIMEGTFKYKGNPRITIVEKERITHESSYSYYDSYIDEIYPNYPYDTSHTIETELIYDLVYTDLLFIKEVNKCCKHKHSDIYADGHTCKDTWDGHRYKVTDFTNLSLIIDKQINYNWNDTIYDYNNYYEYMCYLFEWGLGAYTRIKFVPKSNVIIQSDSQETIWYEAELINGTPLQIDGQLICSSNKTVIIKNLLYQKPPWSWD